MEKNIARGKLQKKFNSIEVSRLIIDKALKIMLSNTTYIIDQIKKTKRKRRKKHSTYLCVSTW